MADRRYRVCVIGAGIIGLSTAYRLKEAVPDVDITIVAEEFSPNTTGDGSAGFWRPFLLTGMSDELVWYVSQTGSCNYTKGSQRQLLKTAKYYMC